MEHSAVPDDARGHRDGSPDGLVPAVEALVQLRSDALQWGPNAWDASDGAPPDVAADAAHLPPVAPVVADAGRSAVPVPGGLVQGASFLQERWFVLLGSVRRDAGEPYTPDAAPFAERSFSAQAVAALPIP